MKEIIALAFLSSLTMAAKKDDEDFVNFALKHGKNYKNQSEFARRKANWKAAKWEVAALNSSSSTATYEINFLGDLDNSEKEKMYGISVAEAEDSWHARRELEEDIGLEDETPSPELQSCAPYDWSSRGTKNASPVKD